MTGMVFVADDLGAWLVASLADAGRRRLSTLVLGTDQERALRQAAATAIQLTAQDLRPDGEDQAEQLAMVVSQVFSKQVFGAPLTGQATLLEGLRTGIAGQLAVLDDASLTGTDSSSAAVLGIQAGVLAEKLTGHLVQQIVIRGARGGPLFPLASVLNQNVTQLQGQRLEGLVGQLAEQVHDSLARLDSSRRRQRTESEKIHIHYPLKLPFEFAYFTDGELASAMLSAAKTPYLHDHVRLIKSIYMQRAQGPSFDVEKVFWKNSGLSKTVLAEALRPVLEARCRRERS